MDLGTVSKKLAAGKYRLVEECLDDLQLIWDNCKLYNAYASVMKHTLKNIFYFFLKWIWKLADKLEKSFKKYVKNYLPLVNLPQPSKGFLFVFKRFFIDRDVKQKDGSGDPHVYQDDQQEQITYNDKVEFANNLKQLQPEQIGLIVHMIQNSCPSAFIEVDKEKYQIVVDNVDGEVFVKCVKQIEVWLSGDQSSKKMKI